MRPVMAGTRTPQSKPKGQWDERTRLIRTTCVLDWIKTFWSVLRL